MGGPAKSKDGFLQAADRPEAEAAPPAAPNRTFGSVPTELRCRGTCAENAMVLGVPTNAVRANSQRFGPRASLAIYLRPDQPAGIWHPSPLNGETTSPSMTGQSQISHPRPPEGN